MTKQGDARWIGGLTKVTVYPMCQFAPKDCGPWHCNTEFKWIPGGKIPG